MIYKRLNSFFSLSSLGLLLCFVISPASVLAQDPAFITRLNASEQGFVLFQERCMACHGRADMEQAPDPAVLRAMPAQRIYDALTSGAMQIHAKDLSDQDIRWVAESISGQLLGDNQQGSAENMPNQCSANPAFSMQGSNWNGWGQNAANTRFQNPQNAGLSAKQVPQLKLKWAFAYANGVSAFSQPSVVGGRVFVGSDTGYVYSLDAETGCVYWSFKPDSNVRSTISIGPVLSQGETTYAAYFGDMKANIYAIDVHSGELLWQQDGDEEISARITASPTLHDGVLYVPMSSWEEAASRSRNYPCCTFRGSVAAYNSSTGEQLWKTYSITDSPQATKVNTVGTQLYGPAGASVWHTPVVDPVARAIYFGTGNAFTYPAPATSDAVIALDMDTGAVRWSYQVNSDDAFLVGCGALPTENCPEELGPDRDVPVPLILKELSNGKRALIVGTRPGGVLSLDPDKAGSLNWQMEAADINGRGIIWGGAADSDKVYYGLSSGGMLALSLVTGEIAWFSPIAENSSHGSVVTLIDGVAFIGGGDGIIHALATKDGSELWQYNSDKEFMTVNGIPARGGSISASGSVIANGMLFANSGYQVLFGKPGNVLMAFGLQ